MSDDLTPAEEVVKRLDSYTQEQHEEGIRKARERRALAKPYPARLYSDCPCAKCDFGIDIGIGALVASRMSVCPTCGNKRCPKGTDHDLECTGSNEPGQEGSRYA